MSQTGKSSSKRSSPSYFMSILGITLVLFLLGIIGWFVINAKQLGDFFKAKIELRAYVLGDLNPKDSVALTNYISSKPYVRTIEYVNKEMAKKKYMSDGGEDWNQFISKNPLPNAFFFNIKNEYLNNDSLNTIKADLEAQTYITEVKWPVFAGNMSENLRKISFWLLGIAVVLAVVVIVLIDNTIRLAMFSNRFLIKTMQMVGATRGFIAKPMNIRAIINGAIGGAIAALAIYILVVFLEQRIIGLAALRDNAMLYLLFAILILLGICITLFSTHRSVMKYLRMKLDDLY